MAQTYGGVSEQERITLLISQDNAFSFSVGVEGSFRMGGSLDFTFYGLFWTNPSFGNLLNGSSTWLETGVGLRYDAFGDRLTLLPRVGLSHGRLLSDGPDGKLAEGIVPSLLVSYTDLPLEMEVYAAYYKGLASIGRNAGDYVLYWLLPGVRLSPNVSMGIHYERFVKTRTAQGDPGPLYEWLGGYIKFTVQDRYTFRFSGGVNTFGEGNYGPDFYKLALVLPL